MTKAEKVLYILSIIFSAIAVIGGILGLVGFFVKLEILQIIGATILILSFIASTILDFIAKKKGRKNDR